MNDVTPKPRKTSYPAVGAAVLSLIVFLTALALFSNKMQSTDVPEKEKVISGVAMVGSLAVFGLAIAFAVFRAKAVGIMLSLGMAFIAMGLLAFGFPFLLRLSIGSYMSGFGDAAAIVAILIGFTSGFCAVGILRSFKSR